MMNSVVIGAIGWNLMGVAALGHHLRTWGVGACPPWQWPFVIVFWPLVYAN